MLLTGFLEFDDELVCLSEVLGKTLMVKIGSVNATMAFPRLSEKSFKNSENNYEFFPPLDAPLGAEKWEQGGRPLYWGRPISFPEISVEIARIAFFIECSESNVKSVAHDLYNDMPRWKEAFIHYCELTNNSYPRKSLDVDTKNCGFDLYSDKHIESDFIDSVTIYVDSSSKNISLSQINDACTFASSGKDLHIEYEMIIETYHAIEKKQYKLAIIDACSALEICLDRKITDYCLQINFDPEILLSKYRLLSDKVTLIRKFYPGFSSISGIKEKIIVIRNNVAHSRTISPTDKETNDLLKKVEDCLQFFYNDFYEL